MNESRSRIVTEAVVMILILVTLFSGVGYFGYRTVVAWEGAETRAEDGLDLGDLEKLINLAIEKVLPTAKQAPPPAPPKQPETAAAPEGAKPASGKKWEIVEVKFFESGKQAPPAKERKYAEQFTIQAQYINTYVNFRNGSYQVADAEIACRVEYYNAAGVKIGSFNQQGQVKKEWQRVNFARGVGSETPGFWKAGKYSVKVFLDGELAGRYEFKME